MSPLKVTLKRGALLAAANWQVILIQAVADSLFKVLIAVPGIGGAFLVALVIGAEPSGLLALEWREMITTSIAALFSHPAVLTAFLLSLAVVIVGGSLFMFLVKAGTVAVVVEGDRRAGPVEQRPLHLSVMLEASGYSAERFMDACQRFFPRYARLGFGLITVYLVSGLLFLTAVVMTRLTGSVVSDTALLTALFVAWITVVNLLYLLLQIIVSVDDCSVRIAVRRLMRFLREDARRLLRVFAVMLAIVVLATGVSVLAMGALGLIAFVPFFGLVVLPLQLVAWLFRAVVFQYIGLTQVGAYLKIYRAHAAALAAAGQPIDKQIPNSKSQIPTAAPGQASTGI
jgi:hypothetical protein